MEYYYIKISNFLFIFWFIFSILLTIFSTGKLFLLLIIPIIYWIILKSSKYYYNDDKLIIEIGIFNKRQHIVPLYRIVNITAQDNIFNFGNMYIRDKQQTIILKYVNHSKLEMLNLVEKWEKAKEKNIRNEVI